MIEICFALILFDCGNVYRSYTDKSFDSAMETGIVCRPPVIVHRPIHNTINSV